jgi:chitinase
MFPKTTFIALLTLCGFCAKAQPCREVIAYFPSWKWYDRNHFVNPGTIDYSKYTIINYAFFQPNPDGSVSPFDPRLDRLLLLGEDGYETRDHVGGKGGVDWGFDRTSLVAQAHRHGVQVVISIGGWTLSQNFSDIAANSERRQRFARSCADLVRWYGIDGIDIDWEYPGYISNGGSSRDRRNFTLLLRAIRQELDALALETGKPLILTSAFGVSPERMADIEWEAVTPLLDHVHLMTYDFYGSSHPVTNHHAPLFAPSKGINGYDMHSCVMRLIERYGVPPEKITIGIAFYGRSLKTKGKPGLHVASIQTPDHSTFPDDAGAPMFYNLLDKQHLFDYQWDTLAQAPYLKGRNALQTFVSFEDQRSVKQKAKYILDYQLAGAMVWDLTGDYVESWPGSGILSSTPLADALAATLCGQDIPHSPDAFQPAHVKPVLARLPQPFPTVKRRDYAPRLAHVSPPFPQKTKKEKKRKRKKDRQSGRYFDGGWGCL